MEIGKISIQHANVNKIGMYLMNYCVSSACVVFLAAMALIVLVPQGCVTIDQRYVLVRVR